MIYSLRYWLHFIRCYLKKKERSSTSNIQKKLIVSMTTTPVRIKKIWPTLNSILLQSVKPEKIYLWIPLKYKRFPQSTIDQIPDFIKNNPLIQVEFIEEDLGPATKLLPCLRLPIPEDTNIVVIDDDRVYPRHLIRDLLKYEQLEPHSALGIAGTVTFGSHRHHHNEYVTTKNIAMVDILLGYNGYLVKPMFFSKAVFEYPENLPEAFFEDDVWFSGHLERRGVRRILIPSKPGTQNILTLDQRTFGLYLNENKDRSNFFRVLNYFKQQSGRQVRHLLIDRP